MAKLVLVVLAGYAPSVVRDVKLKAIGTKGATFKAAFKVNSTIGDTQYTLSLQQFSTMRVMRVH